MCRWFLNSCGFMFNVLFIGIQCVLLVLLLLCIGGSLLVGNLKWKLWVMVWLCWLWLGWLKICWFFSEFFSIGSGIFSWVFLCSLCRQLLSRFCFWLMKLLGSVYSFLLGFEWCCISSMWFECIIIVLVVMKVGVQGVFFQVVLYCLMKWYLVISWVYVGVFLWNVLSMLNIGVGILLCSISSVLWKLMLLVLNR